MNREATLLIVMAIILTVVAAIVSSLWYTSIRGYIDPLEEILSCETAGVSGYCIEVQFRTTLDKDGKDMSKFIFPHSLRQGDYLMFEKIKIIALSEKLWENISQSALIFNVTPKDGYLEHLRGIGYGVFRFPIQRDIQLNDVYEIIRTKEGVYTHYFKNEMVYEQIEHEIELAHVGEWSIGFDIKGGNLTGWTTLFNGRWLGDVFYVYPRYEIQSLRISNISMSVGVISFFVFIFIELITYGAYIIGRSFDKKYNQRCEQLLNDIASEIKVFNQRCNSKK